MFDAGCFPESCPDEFIKKRCLLSSADVLQEVNPRHLNVINLLLVAHASLDDESYHVSID